MLGAMSQMSVRSVPGWAQACSSAFVPLRVRSAAQSFRASLNQHILSPDVSLTRVASGASEVYRSDQIIRENPRDDLLISLHRSGSGSVSQHGRQVKLVAGRATMYDASAPYVLSFPGRISEVVLQVPRRCLPMSRNAFADLTARPLPDGGPLRALTALATSAEADAAPGPLENAALADALMSLLRATLSSSSAVQPPQIDSELLVTAARQYIDEHLADPLLSPGRVADHHHISLRLLQKLFTRVGDSPVSYIRRRRLEHSRHLLLHGATVGQAATAVGFNDVDTFTRAFKRLYHELPSRVRPTGVHYRGELSYS